MKKILFVLLLLLLCGCTSNYDLEISNDTFKENIKVYINKDEIPKETVEGIELDDPITPFLKNKQSALFSNKNAFYKKKVNDIEDHYEVDMKYTYTEKNFGDSNSLKLCFDNYDFYYKDNYYIHAYGEFFCLYSDELNINIKTDNKVIKNNADSVNGNVYTWKVDKTNVNNVDIEFKVEKGFPYKTLISYLIAFVVILFVAIIGYLIYFKNKKVNKI